MADKGPSAFDPADLFRDDPEAGKGLAKNIEDFFGEPPAGPSPKRAEGEARAPEAGHGGMSEEEWRASPQYEEFRKKVIARHLQKKAEEEARAQASQGPGTAPVEQGPTDEERKQELLEKYKAAKAATIAQRKAAVPPPPPPPLPQPEKAPAPPSPPPKKEPPPLPPLKILPPSAFSPLPPLRPLPPLPSVPPKEKGNG
ncbi:MAG TPA: hypothetical protein VK914_01370 [bacterium]|jgi:hypothetical protein|nr:hypothetical protein [bacterium]